MRKKEYLSLQRLTDCLKEVEDPRRNSGNFMHRLIDILVIALLAMICGCETWDEIEDYGNTKLEWLKTYLPLKNAIPSADTFRRLFERIKPMQLEKAYREWVEPYVGSCLNKQISVDGKTMRGATGGCGEGFRLHMVSAWVREDGITLGQIKVDDKSNEITAIPQLLESLDISGGTVSIDAMGCQRAIAQVITEREANYVLAVKMNQPTLYQEISEYFTWAVQDAIESKHLSRYEVREKDHGRISTWVVTATQEVSWFESKQDWAFLRTMIMVQRKTMKGENVSHETQYYISSLAETATAFHRLIRGHWSVENQLHWVMDVSFREDDSLIHKDHSPQNLSLIRKIALAILKKDTSRKASLRRKQNIAGWDDSFLASLFSSF